MRAILVRVAVGASVAFAVAIATVPFGSIAAAQQGTRTTPGPVGAPAPFEADPRSAEIVRRRTEISQRLPPVTEATLQHPSPGDWLLGRRTNDMHAFSPLAEITRDNVHRLTTAWSWSLPPGTSQATPLVYDGILFLHSAGDVVQALDATNGDLIWEYDRPGDRTSGVHRNMGIWENKLIFGSDDGHLVALDFKTGKVAWDTGFPDSDKWRMSAGTLVVKGVVIQGAWASSNCPPGGCPVIAVDANTGKELWRLRLAPFAADPGGHSWNGLPDDQRIGPAVWTVPSYDPELNLVYMTTGNTYHWQELMKGGPHKTPHTNRDGLYIDSILAVEPQTGKIRWHFQNLPEDYWDLDFAFEPTIATLTVDGQRRKVVCSTGKMVWTDCVDAATGKFVLAHDHGFQNVIKSYDKVTGRKTYFDEVIPDLSGQRRLLQCSAGYGAKSWNAGAFDASTGVTYTALAEVCAESAPHMFGPNETAYQGPQETRRARYHPKSDGNIGRLDAVNWVENKILWTVRQRAAFVSAIVATAGRVGFVGDADRWFHAFDLDTGKTLWKTRLNNSVSSYPITYAVNGKQYVAVVAGCCGNGRLNNVIQFTPEIRAPRGNPASLWVFELSTSPASQSTTASALSVQDYHEIEQLYARYYHAIDSGNAEAYVAVFTPDGVFNQFRGQQALRDYITNGTAKGTPMRHWMSNLQLTPVPGGAEGKVYVMQFNIQATPITPATYSRYDDVLVKTPDGWRFKQRLRSSDTTMGRGAKPTARPQ